MHFSKLRFADVIQEGSVSQLAMTATLCDSHVSMADLFLRRGEARGQTTLFVLTPECVYQEQVNWVGQPRRLRCAKQSFEKGRSQTEFGNEVGVVGFTLG